MLCPQRFLLQSEMSISWKDSSGPEDNLALQPIMVILQIFCLSVTEAFLNALTTFIALVPYVHPSLVEKLGSFWDQAVGSPMSAVLPEIRPSIVLSQIKSSSYSVCATAVLSAWPCGHAALLLG